MKKHILVRILFFLATAVFIILIGAYLFRNSLLKPRLEDMLSKKLDSSVEIEGFVFHVFRSEIHMDAITVSHKTSSVRLLIQSAAIDMRLSLLPLLFDNTIHIESLKITDLKVLVPQSSETASSQSVEGELQNLIQSLNIKNILQAFVDKNQSAEYSNRLQADLEQLLASIAAERKELQGRLNTVRSEIQSLETIQVRSLANAQKAVNKSRRTYEQVTDIYTKIVEFQQIIQDQQTKLSQASKSLEDFITEDVNLILQDLSKPRRLASEVTMALLEQILSGPITRYYNTLNKLLAFLQSRQTKALSSIEHTHSSNLIASLITDATENVEPLPPLSSLDEVVLELPSSFDLEMNSSVSPQRPIVPETKSIKSSNKTVLEREEALLIEDSRSETQQESEKSETEDLPSKKAYSIFVEDLFLSFTYSNESLFVLRAQNLSKKVYRGSQAMEFKILRSNDNVPLEGRAKFSLNPSLPMLEASLDFSGISSEIQGLEQIGINQYRGKTGGRLELYIQNPQEGRAKLFLSTSEIHAIGQEDHFLDTVIRRTLSELPRLNFESSINFKDNTISQFHIDPKSLDSSSLLTVVEKVIEMEWPAVYKELNRSLALELSKSISSMQNELVLQVQEQQKNIEEQIDLIVKLQDSTSDKVLLFQKELQVYLSKRAQREAERIQETIENKFKDFGSRFGF